MTNFRSLKNFQDFLSYENAAVKEHHCVQSCPSVDLGKKTAEFDLKEMGLLTKIDQEKADFFLKKYACSRLFEKVKKIYIDFENHDYETQLEMLNNIDISIQLSGISVQELIRPKKEEKYRSIFDFICQENKMNDMGFDYESPVSALITLFTPFSVGDKHIFLDGKINLCQVRLFLSLIFVDEISERVWIEFLPKIENVSPISCFSISDRLIESFTTNLLLNLFRTVLFHALLCSINLKDYLFYYIYLIDIIFSIFFIFGLADSFIFNYFDKSKSGCLLTFRKSLRHVEYYNGTDEVFVQAIYYPSYKHVALHSFEKPGFVTLDRLTLKNDSNIRVKFINSKTGYNFYLSTLGNFSLKEDGLSNEYVSNINWNCPEFYMHPFAFEKNSINISNTVLIIQFALMRKFKIDFNFSPKECPSYISKHMSNKLQACYSYCMRKENVFCRVSIGKRYLPLAEHFYQNDYLHMKNISEKDLPNKMSVKAPEFIPLDNYQREIVKEVVQQTTYKEVDYYEEEEEIITEEVPVSLSHLNNFVEAELKKEFGPIYPYLIDRKQAKKLKFFSYRGLALDTLHGKKYLFEPEFFEKVSKKHEEVLAQYVPETKIRETSVKRKVKKTKKIPVINQEIIDVEKNVKKKLTYNEVDNYNNRFIKYLYKPKKEFSLSLEFVKKKRRQSQNKFHYNYLLNQIFKTRGVFSKKSKNSLKRELMDQKPNLANLIDILKARGMYSRIKPFKENYKVNNIHFYNNNLEKIFHLVFFIKNITDHYNGRLINMHFHNFNMIINKERLPRNKYKIGGDMHLYRNLNF
jgi:hypothetical protein